VDPSNPSEISLAEMAREIEFLRGFAIDGESRRVLAFYGRTRRKGFDSEHFFEGFDLLGSEVLFEHGISFDTEVGVEILWEMGRG
jgi:hypothetical protein